MLFNTYKTYPYTVDYYSYTIITSADGTVTTKRYVTIPEQIKLSVTTSYIGDLVIFSKNKMQLEGILKNLKDKNNVEIYEGGEWQITQTQPMTSPVGLVIGYRYKARLIGGNV
jgi:hypothetical protein